MNANQILNMITRMIMRKIINKGINAGVKKVGSVGRKKSPPIQDDYEPRQRAQQMTHAYDDDPVPARPPKPAISPQKKAKQAARRARRAAEKSNQR